MQAPETHWPPPQVLPQLEQFCGSVCGFTHTVPQRMKPMGHAAWQVPLEQTPVPHETPHMPQLFGSERVLVHWPLHWVWPGAQVQVPLTQEPSPQLVPHAPQLFESV